MAATKLLLLEDVENLGRKGEVASVSPGYARNKLIPSGLAIPASKEALRIQEKLKIERAKKAAADRADAEQLKAKIEAAGNLTTIVKVDHEGSMYGSVSALDIIHLMEKQSSIVLEKRYVQLKHAIKQTGEHTIHLKLDEGVTADIKLVIEAENAQAPKA